MHTSVFWQRFVKTIESGDLDDLRQDMILEIGVVAIAIGWIFAASAISYHGHIEQLPAALIMLAGTIFCLWLRVAYHQAASYGLIATLLVSVTLFKWTSPDGLAQFYYPVVIVVSSLLVPSLRVFGVAGVASGAGVIMARMHGAAWTDPLQMVIPVTLIFLTAFAAWLGSHQVNLVLSWMHDNYRRAESLVEELRTERMAQARALKALEEAYVRIEKVNYALIEARSLADEARRLKVEFAANVSHELRTPLNIIIGFSETMANAPETYGRVTWSSMLRGDIEQIYQNARHLSALIDDILDLSALEVNRLGLTMEEIDLQSVVEEAVAMMKDLFRVKNLYLTVETESALPPLRVDPIRIRQVLINLLTNASRFTHQGGVTIHLQRVEDEIQVAVSDTGIGIAPQDIPRVFADFGQVDGSASRKHEGTGLGVPLSKRLVEQHRGRMWLESQVGVGTKFHFALPLSAQSAAGGPGMSPTSAQPGPAYRRAVLMFEPDPLLLRTVRRHLSGHDVIAVPSLADLPGLIERYQPEALVVERTNEISLARLKETGIPPDLPVVSISMPGSLRAAQSLQLENYLIKPILREQLIEAIENLEQPVHKILIVDDDAQLVELISRMLQSTGKEYHALKAFGGPQALQLLSQEPIDLVLLDLIMPEMSGLTVLEEMKADPRLAHIPVIVISAQYPDTVCMEGGVYLELWRSKNASITEMFGYLRTLVSVLPLRGLQVVAGAPEPPGAQSDPPVSLDRLLPRAKGPARAHSGLSRPLRECAGGLDGG